MQVDAIHEEAAARLLAAGQRYTAARRELVAAMREAGRPLTIPELVGVARGVPQSSAYRNVAVLMEAGVVRRIAGTDDHARFELAEELLGHHHHHLVCAQCGRVEDIDPSATLELALGEAARQVARQQGYEITEHRLDLEGVCPDCRRVVPRGQRE